MSFACEKARVSRVTAYKHRDRFPKFRAAWDEALEISIDLLETAARFRAFSGPLDPQSATLLIFLLKAHRPEKYRDNTKKLPDVPTGRDVMLEAEKANAEFDAATKSKKAP